MRGVSGYDRKTLKRAKSLRHNLTDAERVLWQALRGGQVSSAKFRRQQPIGPYIVDFVCQSHRLIVEADGGQHADRDHDRRRDAFLASKGYRVVRFWNHDVRDNLDGILTAIRVALANGPSPTTTSEQARKSSYPLPQGERDKEPHA